jgi:hypothetical protein
MDGAKNIRLLEVLWDEKNGTFRLFNLLTLSLFLEKAM